MNLDREKTAHADLKLTYMRANEDFLRAQQVMTPGLSELAVEYIHFFIFVINICVYA